MRLTSLHRDLTSLQGPPQDIGPVPPQGHGGPGDLHRRVIANDPVPFQQDQDPTGVVGPTVPVREHPVHLHRHRPHRHSPLRGLHRRLHRSLTTGQ